MKSESALLQRKIRYLDLAPLVSVSSNIPLQEAIRTMQSQHVGCVLVTENHGLVGIFTERDLLLKVMGTSIDHSRPVGDFMTREPAVLHLDNSVADAIQLMDAGGYRDVPLVDSAGGLVGRIEVSNIIDFLAENYPQELLSLPPRSNQSFVEPDGA